MKGHSSNKIVSDALLMLENMNHRGACGCEPDSGDGAGIMVKMPHEFFQKRCKKLGISLPQPGQYGVGMMFLPKDLVARRECEQVFEKVVRDYGMVVLGWRDVPVNSAGVGPTPRQTEPKIRQVFVGMGESFYNRMDFDRRLYLVRQRAENIIEFGNLSPTARQQFYICILSANRTVYKGMLTATQVRQYYPDLAEPDFLSALAIVHSRFLDQYLSILGSGPPLPLCRPQRRNQHAPRQPQLDAGAVRITRIAGFRRRAAQDVSDSDRIGI